MELISRDEAIVMLEDMEGRRDEDGYIRVYKCDVIDNLRSLPTIEERKEGEWIDTDYINLQLDTYLARCSECEYHMDVHNNRGYFKYCPNCGAKMYEDDKDIYVPNKGE